MANCREYSSPITRKTPSAIAFIVDRSGSMAERVMFGRDNITKAEAVARIINRAITDIGMRCRRSDGVYDYLDIAVLGYSGDKVESLLTDCCDNPNVFIPISELVCAEVPDVSYRLLFEKATISPSMVTVKEYITAYAEGKTPMKGAICEITRHVNDWIKRHSGLDCFVPMVFNITDGEATDASVAEIIKASSKLKNLSTEDGRVLFFNINLRSLTTAEQNELLFPSHIDEIASCNDYVNMLFEISSVLPEIFYKQIAKMKGCKVDYVRGARALGYNVKVVDFFNLLTIGSVNLNRIR